MVNKVNKLRNIVVTTDLSENSDFAIIRAARIAKSLKANLIILHVIEKKFFDATLESIIAKEILQTPEEYATNFIQKKIHQLSRYKLNINYIIISKGKPAIKITQYIKKNKIDLLVMGAHGKYTLRDTFVGTTAEYLIKKTSCPVLIVKNEPYKAYRKILVPVDFTNVSKKVLKYVIQLFPESNIRLIHIGDYAYENLLQQVKYKDEIPKHKIIKMRKAILFYLQAKMKKFIHGYTKKLNKKPFTITLGYPGPTIINETKEQNLDLIAMGTQGHGHIHYLFIGSVANYVLTETDKDILLVPPKK